MNHDENKAGWNFDNTYARLPKEFFTLVKPSSVREPKVALFNEELAQALGLNVEALKAEASRFLSGNEIPPGAQPLAQAYAGHQFGHPNMLGDGRANLLGEHITPSGARFDIQLKGSGPTPYSRRGDGRATLSAMLREYLISEAMFGLGIPTTRSLAVVATGEPVRRETLLPGAVLTRVAASHIRVGTFEYAAATQNLELVRALADYTIDRHYPELKSEENPYLALLHSVIERQASLITKWMLVGFIHGVMNTDNMALSGETIDYGPCAFMDRYSLATVFSSIDQNGRYAFGNQPRIAEWNLTRLAETLLPLIDSNQDAAIAKAQDILATFAVHFEHYFMSGMRAKLGLTSVEEDDITLITSLLAWLEKTNVDYTKTFRALSESTLTDSAFQDSEFKEWHKRWQLRNPSSSLMLATNPAVIARNHKVEEALAAAVEREDYSVAQRLLSALRSPFEATAENAEFREPPPNGNEGYKTFCGT